MTYIYFIVGILILLYGLTDFKKKPTDTAENRYFNSKYYRVVILLAFAIVGLILYIILEIFK